MTPATTGGPVQWGGEDLNLRRLRRQIYSLLPLATRAPPHTQASRAEANVHDTQTPRAFQEGTAATRGCAKRRTNRASLAHPRHRDAGLREEEHPRRRPLLDERGVHGCLQVGEGGHEHVSDHLVAQFGHHPHLYPLQD